MDPQVVVEDGRLIVVLPVHFDVASHSVSLPLFIETATRVARVGEELGRDFFGDGYAQEVLVLPPEDGTFLTRLGIVVLAIWGFSTVGPGSSFIKGLTGQSAEDWMEDAGRLIREQATDLKDKLESTIPDKNLDKSKLACNLAVVEATRQFMMREEEDLVAGGISKDAFWEAYEARNEFYAACAQVSEVHGIGYTEEPSFPIRRSEFTSLQVLLPPKKDPEVADPWIVEIT